MKRIWDECKQKYFVNMKPEIKLQIVLVGETGIGKTSLVTRFTKDIFKERVPRTVLVDSTQKSMTVGGKRVTLIIWDTGGQQCYKVYVQNYIKQADGVILLYDVTNRESFNKLKDNWLRDVRQINRESHLLIVGNKIDKLCPKQVSSSELRDFVNCEGIAAMEMSAKSGDNVEKVFHRLVFSLVCGAVAVNNPNGDSVTVTKDERGTPSPLPSAGSFVKEKKGPLDSEPRANFPSPKRFPRLNIRSVLPEQKKLRMNYQIPFLFKIFIYLCITTFLLYYLTYLFTCAFGPVNLDFVLQVFNRIESLWYRMCEGSQICDKILSSLKTLSTSLILYT